MAKRIDEYFTQTIQEGEASVTAIAKEKLELVFTPEAPSDLDEVILISMGYDGQRYSVYLKLYDPKTHRVYLWYDDSHHRPYCYSTQPVSDLQKNKEVVNHPGFERLGTVEKYDALRERKVQVTKIIVKDPLSIGGKPTGCIRDVITAWEADIKYVENYVYDVGLQPGMPYRLRNGKLQAIDHPSCGAPLENIRGIFLKESEEYMELAKSWLRLLETPVPSLKRAALDIEVYSPVSTRVPDPGEAEHEVICASVIGNDGVKRILLLRRSGIELGAEPLPEAVQVKYFDKEEDLLAEIFKAFVEYPIIVTFNGDDFDLRYLWNRAQKVGIGREQIPIDMGRDTASLKYGVHIDLYKFFFNRAIQIYAFGQRYRENTLDAVGQGLIDMEKKELEAPVSDLTYTELASYCYRDSEITLALTTFDDNLVMKLMVALSRISCMTIEDVTRQGVSGWIRSIMYKEHRARGYLIPRPDEILQLKGTTTTEAVIKGKKYKGAIVVEPIPGVHFNVAVLDFMSMYPSVIKQWNLGYETILCGHGSCKNNRIPGTPHWVCKKNRSLESLLIGSLRDLRVNWYKPKAKDKTLPPQVRSWYKIISDALKVVLNASYGVFGNDKFALYCPPVAEATAAIGRYIISTTIDKAKELGIEVFYGDTDSIFLGSPSHRQLENLIEWSKNTLGMELEVDKNYRYLALSSRKKNYLGVYPDGSVDIKGLTGKKRHIPDFLKNAFYDMIQTLSKVESQEQFEAAKDRIKEIVKEAYLKLKNRNYSLNELAFTVMISKPPNRYVKTTPQHVKAAQLLAKTGVEIRPGDLISFVKTTNDLGVKPIQLASINEVDIKKYMEYISSTFDQVLDTLGTEFTELTGSTKLETFFG